MKPEISRAMIGMGWDVTRISAHAGDEQTYHRIHGVNGRFESLRRYLKEFVRLRLEAGADNVCRLLILNVLQRESIGSIERMFAFAEDVGADEIIFEKVIPYNESMILSAGELSRAQDQLAACADRSHVPCNLGEILSELHMERAANEEGRSWVPARRCSVGFDQTFITAEGDVLPCCFSNEVMGNLRTQSFSEIWRGAKYRDFRRRLINGRFADYCIINRCTMKGVLHN
jgi:radical SAM protein with 4Fe4S-binding SPASM domain